MKKLILGMFLLMSMSQIILAQEGQQGNKGKIQIKYDGGILCWMGYSGCKGEILIEWRTAPPSDVEPVTLPQGFQYISMQTEQFEKVNRTFEEKTFVPKETSNGSSIYIPKQEGKFSKSLNAFIVFAKVK